MIVIEKLTKIFGYYPVLRGIDLSIEKGQFLALLGPNGSGKTTLLRILTGLSKPSGGQITIGGWNIPDEIAAVRQQLGIVSHLTLLYDTLTAEENLMFFARLYNLPQETRAERVAAMLERVGLGKRAKDVVNTFSRGMQQRLAIARALIHDPAILLLDEPYTGLDQDASALLDQLLHDVAGVAEGQRTTIMTTHDLRRAHSLTSHVAILSRGKVGFYGETTAIPADDLPRIYADTLGAAS
ncbi:MAG: heme ABC exporter ATP-binding protein CcmA [Anaerolineales bacterium]|nr:heme ABC exporter ATP-binding protein CcmA [Anaerolineales bacterium]